MWKTNDQSILDSHIRSHTAWMLSFLVTFYFFSHVSLMPTTGTFSHQPPLSQWEQWPQIDLSYRPLFPFSTLLSIFNIHMFLSRDPLRTDDISCICKCLCSAPQSWHWSQTIYIDYSPNPNCLSLCSLLLPASFLYTWNKVSPLKENQAVGGDSLNKRH